MLYLRNHTRGRGVTTLIITGIHTHICIKHTSYGAFIKGYNIIIPEDAVNAFTKEDHESGLSYIKDNYGAQLMRTSEIIKNLCDRLVIIETNQLQYAFS
ncbi:MAG: cysteine hydrolase family protein [Nitrososphaeraceae archaeon]